MHRRTWAYLGLAVSIALNMALGALIVTDRLSQHQAGPIAFQSAMVKDAADDVTKYEQTHDSSLLQDAIAKLYVVSGQYLQYSEAKQDARFFALYQVCSEMAGHLQATQQLNADDKERLNLFFEHLPDDNDLMTAMEKDSSQYLARVDSLWQDLNQRHLLVQ